MRKFFKDVFDSYLVETALFDSVLEIPRIEKPSKIIIPEEMIPFSKRKSSKDFHETVVFYEHDYRFMDFVENTYKYVDELRQFKSVVTPDCSLYRDMPLIQQLNNIYINRAVGVYLQSQGIYVIPNIRWGDERTYTTCELPVKAAFLGVEKQGIVSVGTYGCIRGKENEHYFKEGLAEMIKELEPDTVLVYGAMPDSIFADFINDTEFINFPDWITNKKGGK